MTHTHQKACVVSDFALIAVRYPGPAYETVDERVDHRSGERFGELEQEQNRYLQFRK